MHPHSYSTRKDTIWVRKGKAQARRWIPKARLLPEAGLHPFSSAKTCICLISSGHGDVAWDSAEGKRWVEYTHGMSEFSNWAPGILRIFGWGVCRREGGELESCPAHASNWTCLGFTSGASWRKTKCLKTSNLIRPFHLTNKHEELKREQPMCPGQSGLNLMTHCHFE